jgi:hypothetical protein
MSAREIGVASAKDAELIRQRDKMRADIARARMEDMEENLKTFACLKRSDVLEAVALALMITTDGRTGVGKNVGAYIGEDDIFSFSSDDGYNYITLFYSTSLDSMPREYALTIVANVKKMLGPDPSIGGVLDLLYLWDQLTSYITNKQEIEAFYLSTRDVSKVQFVENTDIGKYRVITSGPVVNIVMVPAIRYEIGCCSDTTSCKHGMNREDSITFLESKCKTSPLR